MFVCCASQIGQWNARRNRNNQQYFALPASPTPEWLWSLQVWGCQWHQLAQSGCAYSHTRWVEYMHQNTVDFPSLRMHVIGGITPCDIALQAEMWHCITLTHSVHTDKLSSIHPWYSVLALIILDLVLIACLVTLINIRSPDLQKGSSCAKQLQIFKASSELSALLLLCPLSLAYERSVSCFVLCVCVWCARSSGCMKSVLSVEALLLNEVLIVIWFFFYISHFLSVFLLFLHMSCRKRQKLAVLLWDVPDS